MVYMDTVLLPPLRQEAIFSTHGLHGYSLVTSTEAGGYIFTPVRELVLGLSFHLTVPLSASRISQKVKDGFQSSMWEGGLKTNEKN